FVAMYDVLDHSERRPWLLVLPPILMALWTNLHGAFPAGIMLIGCWWAQAAWTAWCTRKSSEPPGLSRRYSARRFVQLSVCLATAVAATLFNPYAWGIYLYVGQTSNLAAARGIDEWLPPTPDRLIGITFFASLPILLGLMLLAWKKRGTALLGARELF